MKKTRKKDMKQENIFLRNPINYHKKVIKKFSTKIQVNEKEKNWVYYEILNH